MTVGFRLLPVALGDKDEAELGNEPAEVDVDDDEDAVLVGVSGGEELETVEAAGLVDRPIGLDGVLLAGIKWV